MLRKGRVRSRVIAELRKNPDRKLVEIARAAGCSISYASKIAADPRPDTPALGPNAKTRILNELADNPFRSGVAIARAAQTNAGYVSMVARAAGIPYGRARWAAAGGWHGLSPENQQWVHDQASAFGVPTADFINGCVTDARLEDQQEAA